MSEKQQKKLRREVRKYLREAGATQDQIRAQWRLQLKPRPWWVPRPLWTWLVGRFVQDPPGLAGQLALVDHAVPERPGA